MAACLTVSPAPEEPITPAKAATSDLQGARRGISTRHARADRPHYDASGRADRHTPGPRLEIGERLCARADAWLRAPGGGDVDPRHTVVSGECRDSLGVPGRPCD